MICKSNGLCLVEHKNECGSIDYNSVNFPFDFVSASMLNDDEFVSKYFLSHFGTSIKSVKKLFEKGLSSSCGFDVTFYEVEVDHLVVKGSSYDLLPLEEIKRQAFGLTQKVANCLLTGDNICCQKARHKLEILN